MGCTGGSRAPARRRAAEAVALALAVLATLAAPAGAARSSTSEDTSGDVRATAPDVAPAATAIGEGSPCRGHMSWFSVAGPTPVQTRVDHELLIECGGTNISIEGLSELHYDLDLDTTNAFDQGRCGPATLRCLARERMDEPVVAGLPLRHRTWFQMRRTDGTAWTGDSSICVGEGTPTITCEHNQALLAGSSGSESFG